MNYTSPYTTYLSERSKSMSDNRARNEKDLQAVERELSSLRANIADIEFIKDPLARREELRCLYEEKNNELQEKVNLFKSQQAQLQALQDNAYYVNEYSVANHNAKSQELKLKMDEINSQATQLLAELEERKTKLAEFNSIDHLRYKDLFEKKTRLKQEQQEVSIQHQTTSAFNLAKNMRTLLQQQPEWYK